MNTLLESKPDHACSPSAPAKIWTANTLVYSSGGLIVLFCWLLFGDFSWSMRERSVGPMAAWYLDHIGVPNLLFGVLMTSLPALITLILGPIISVKSDRHRGKWGRRIPFLLVTTPFAAFGMIGLAVTPFVATWVHGHFPAQSEMMVSVVCFSVFWTAFECATIAGGSVFGGLINDVVPAPLLGRFYGLFRAVSLIDGIFFNYWLMGKTPDHFTLMLTIIGVFYGVSFMWVCFKVKEGGYPPPPPLPDKTSLGGVKTYFRECYRLPYYISVYALVAVGGLASIPINTFALPYAKSLSVSMDTYGKCLALTFLISLGLSYFIGWLADIFHPLRLVMITTALYAAVMIWGHFFATAQASFLTAWVLHGVLSGSYFTSVATLGPRLFPREKFAQYASAVGFIHFPLMMGLAPLVGLVIDRSGNTYRYTFTAGALLAVLALVCGWVVYRQFKRLGGPENYIAPQPS